MSNEYDDLLTSQSAVDKSNDYDVALELYQGQQKTQLRSSLAGAVQTNPDQYAQAKQLSAQTGVPAEVVNRNLPQVSHVAKVNEYDNLLQSAPALQDQMRDPEFAKVAHDDLPQLSAVEQSTKNLGPSMVPGADPSLKERTVDWVRHLFGLAPESETRDEGAAARAFIDLYARDNNTTPEQMRESFGGQRAEFEQAAGGFVNSFFAGLAPDRVGEPQNGGEQVARGAGDLAGFLAGAPLRAGQALFGSRFIVNSTDSMVKALAKRVAQQSLVLGTASALSQTGNALDQSSVPDAMKTLGLGGASGAGMGATFGTFGTVLPGNSLLQFLGRAAGTNTTLDVLQGNSPTDDRPLEEKVFDYGLNSLFSLHGAGRTEGGLFRDAQRSTAAQQSAESLQQLTEQAAASKLRARDPASFQQFVQAASADSPVQDVYVDARQFAQSLQQSGVDPATVASQVPSVREQLPEALQIGGDLRIPVGEYAANMAGEKYAQSLLPHLRTSPDAMSAAEAQTFEQSQADQFKAEAAQVMASRPESDGFKESGDRVEQHIFDQLGNANRFTGDVNRGYAQMTRDFYSVQADKLGITPEEMFKRYPLNIQAEPVTGGQHLDQQFHVPRAENLGSEERDIQERFAQQVERNPDEAIKDYADLPESEGGKVLNTDVARELSPDYAKDRSKSAAVHEPASALVKEMYKRKLAEAPREGQDARVVFSAGGTGAGKTTSLRSLEKADPMVSRAQIVYDTNMNKLEGSVKKIEQALDAGKEVTILYTYRHPVEAFTNGMLGRASRMEADKGSGRTVPLIEHAKTHTGSLSVIRDLAQRYGDDPRVKIEVYDNSRGVGQTAASNVESLPYFDYNSLVGELRNVLETEHNAGRISDAIYRGVAGTSEPSRYHQSGSPGKGGSGSQGDRGSEGSGKTDSGTPASISARGQITFARDLSQPSVISLLKNADLSTFLHESGHFFLEVYSDIAAREGAPDSIKADTDALLDWFGVKDLDTWRNMSLEQRRDMHEKFARGFEAYLFDGRAPNHAVQGVFSRFRSWLLNVYKSLTNLHVDLTPEVRGVFDRMLATERQIQVTEAMRAYKPLFEDRKQAGMTEAEWLAYQDLGSQATEDAQDQLQKRSLRDMRWASNARSKALKDLQATADEKRKATRAEVAAEVQQEPIYRAQKALRTGGFDATDSRSGQASEAKGFKLNTEALKEMMPNGEVPAALKGMTSTGGIHPELVAEQFGFRSGEELVGELLHAASLKDAIDAATDQRMLERYGDLTDPVAMARAADAAVHNEARSRFVATELRALERGMKIREQTPAGGSINVLAKAARTFAEATIARKRVRDVSPAQFDAAETRAAKASEKATRKGDLNAALLEKRNQLINGYASRAAHAALTDVQKGLDYLGKFDRTAVRDKLDLEYRDQIDSLLDRFDLRKSVTNKDLKKREALVAFVDRMASMGYEPSVPEYLLDEANRQHYKDMSVEQFRGLVDSVKSIEHLGRLKNKLLDLKEERELDEVATEAAETMEKLPGQVGAQSNRGLTKIEKKWANVKSAGRSMGASLLKMEQMMDWLDDRNAHGVFNRVAFRRIADAGGRENDMQRAMSDRFKTLIKNMPEEATKGTRVYVADGLIDSVTGQPAKFTKKEMLALAGNVGNESNFRKMLTGEGWSEQALWDFLHKNMTKGDWDFVQGVGDSLESLWPEKVAMSRRLGNTNPDKIDPRSFTTPHGEYQGWYWPMIYDPARSQDAAERGARQGDAMFENIYRRANTDTGRMNTRVDSYARPVLFDLDAIPRVIKDEIHDISYREAIIDADKFLSHKDVRGGIVKALGQEYYDQLRPWLQSVANDKAVDTAALKFWQGLAHGARTRATMTGLGFRLTTMLVHGTSAGLESAVEVGPKWFASGLADFRNPMQWTANRDFIFERSAEMRNRMNEVDRDIREHLREIDLRMSDPATSAVTRGLDKVKANAYMGIAMMDMASALPTWMGAYKRAMTDLAKGGLGMGEADAVYFADKSVRNAHGGTGAKDLAAVQRGNEFFKLFTMFYSFWNHNVNRIRDTGRLAASLPATARSGDMKQFRGDLGLVIMRSLVYTLGIQVIHSALHPEKGDDNWGVWAAKQLAQSATAGIPVLRDIAAHFISGRDYSVTPAAQAVQTIGQTVHDAQYAAMGRTTDKWVKHAANTAGYVFGLPLGQVASTGQFLWDVADGRQEPEGVADWWNGMLYGDVHQQ